MNALIKIVAFLVGLLCFALCDLVLQKWIQRKWLRMTASFCCVIGSILLVVGVIGFFSPIDSAVNIDEENVETVTYAYGAGPEWQDGYLLTEDDDICKLIAVLNALELEQAKSRRVNNDLIASESMELILTFYPKDRDLAKKHNCIKCVIFLKDGHTIVERNNGKAEHYKTDYTSVQSVLAELKNNAKIGFMNTSRSNSRFAVIP